MFKTNINETDLLSIFSSMWAKHLFVSYFLFSKAYIPPERKIPVSGAGVGQCPRRPNFALGIPTYWYLKCENLRYPTPNPRRQTPDAKPPTPNPRRQTPDAKPPTPNLNFALAPTPNPDASQWNIGCVGSQRKMLALAMYISCFLCRFHLRLAPNANPISSGIWA